MKWSERRRMNEAKLVSIRPSWPTPERIPKGMEVATEVRAFWAHVSHVSRPEFLF